MRSPNDRLQSKLIQSASRVPSVRNRSGEATGIGHQSLTNVVLLTLVFIGSPITAAAGEKPGTASEAVSPATPATIGLEKIEPVETARKPRQYAGKVTIQGEEVRYRGRLASATISRNDGAKSDKKATVFYTEYVRLGVADKRGRPVTFCFNGGPGSASLWLHLGGLSPMRIELLPDELHPTDWELRPNVGSIIDQTDLVFIDPVSTGFSRPEKNDQKGEFHGYENDVASVSEFIRTWTAENGRWASPQYILGESYGGIRGVSVAQHLFSEHNYATEGLILVSPVVDFQTIRFSESNDLPYAMFLPSYTATAYHHNRINKAKYPTLADAMKAAEKFALGPYAAALLQGDRLPKKQRRRVVAQLAELTGLSEQYLQRADLRVTMSRFAKELLRDKNQIVGRFDGRFTSPAWDGNASGTEFDPSASFIAGAFTEAIQQHYYDSFRLRETKRYAASGDVHPWDYSEFEGRYANASNKLRETLVEQPNLRVLFCLGYTDLATPYMGSLHTISHLDVPASIREHIETTFYDSGHMMYLRQSEQDRLKGDLDRFYNGEAARPRE
ncbi:MAG: S10 family peptidase [Planctomycetaceae bacterium]